MSALGEVRVRIESERSDAERRMRSAIDDVMDGHVSINDAYRNQKVGREALRRELEALGWKDPHRRAARRAS